MILSLIVIVLIGLVVYFHYLQGLFTAGLSAVLAAVAAAVALGCTEWVVALVLGGKFADQAHAMVLVGLFAVTYVVLRTVFDQYVPGNVMFPLWVDRVGAGVMGLVAGIFTAGIFMLAIQHLPFGGSIAGFQRYPIEERTTEIMLPNKSQWQNSTFEEVDQRAFLEGRGESLLLPVDEWAISFISHLSDENGSLSAGRPFATVHPDYLRQLFGQRIGLQAKAKRTALAGSNSVAGVYTAPTLPQFDPERHGRGDANFGARGSKRTDADSLPKLDPQLRLEPEQMLLVIRIRFAFDNCDEKGSFVSFAPGNIRLVASGRNHWPVGVVEGNRVLFVAHIDDPLFVPGDNTADLAFVVDRRDVLANPDDRTDLQLISDAFMEIKRLDRIDLGGQQIKPLASAPRDEKNGLARKEYVMPKVTEVRGGTAPRPADDQATAPQPTQDQAAPQPAPVADTSGQPLTGGTWSTTTTIRFARGLNVGGASPNERDGTASWGGFALRDGKFSRLQVDPIEPVRRMEMGQNLVADFAVPEDQMMFQILMRSNGRWDWASALGGYELVGGDDTRYKAVGFVARAQKDNQAFLAARFDTRSTPDFAPGADAEQMAVGEVLLLFVVPSSTMEIKRLDANGTPLTELNIRR